jgi:hypothetical protein
VKARTIRPKWLDGGVEVLKEIPRSAAGNILRKGVEGFGEAEKDG